jgi:hypothetical protein
MKLNKKTSEALLSMLNAMPTDKRYNNLDEAIEEFVNVPKQTPCKGEEYIACSECGTIQTPICFNKGTSRGKIQECWKCVSIIEFVPEDLLVMD